MAAASISPPKPLGDEVQGASAIADQPQTMPFPYPVSAAHEGGAVEPPAPPVAAEAPPPAQNAEASATDASVASIMHNMSWGAESSAPMPTPENGVESAAPAESGGELNSTILQELQARAMAQAAQAVGLSPSAAMAAMPMLPNLPTEANQSFANALVVPEVCQEIPADGEEDGGAQGEQSFTCSVCRKVFKREMNLIFHMTTHRPRQPQAEAMEPTSTQPVKCQDCNKEFATKYQAKKHYLRRHFQGEKPFACTKCGKKRFVVKEDLTMHMKSCGNVYVCNCGIRLCSLGALKRHCKYFNHEPESLEPKPEPQQPIDWNGMQPLATASQSDNAVAQLQHHQGEPQAMNPLLGAAMQQRMAGRCGGGAAMMGGMPADEQALNMALCSHAAMMRSMMANQAGSHASAEQMVPQDYPQLQPDMLQGMPLSLVHALRQAQADQAYSHVPQDNPNFRAPHMQNPHANYGRFPTHNYPGGMSSSAAALSAAVSAAYTQNGTHLPLPGQEHLHWSRSQAEAAGQGEM
jgi:DNA-directed RNA polymerase subunit RPC12/RpoP